MTFSVLMRQGMDEVSNTFFFFYKSLPVHAVDGLVMIYHPGNVFFIFFFYIFMLTSPLSVTGTLLSIITVLLAERYLIPCPDLRFMIIISSACGDIGDFEIV